MIRTSKLTRYTQGREPINNQQNLLSLGISALFSFTVLGSVLPAPIQAQQVSTEYTIIASSSDNTSCAQLAQRCFSQNGFERSNCFYAAAEDSKCKGSPIEPLIRRRWALSASSALNGDTPPGLLGPSAYDEICLSNCDNRWLNLLVQGAMTTKDVEQIKSCLEGCKQALDLEVLRP